MRISGSIEPRPSSVSIGLDGSRRRRLCKAWLGLIVLAASGMTGALAQEAQKEPNAPAEEMSLLEAEQQASIEAATKTKIPVSKAPGAVTVITAREIQLSGARTIGELLRVVAGVDVRWNVMTQVFTIRGFGENPFTSRVLLLIDGVPYNAWDKGGFPEHPGMDFFTPENIKSMEIIRSPQSALYGEDAYWGVINIVTLSGKDLRGGDVSVFGGGFGQRGRGLGQGDGASNSVAATFRYGNQFGEKGQLLVTAKGWDTIMPRSFWLEQDARNKSLNLFAKANYGPLQLSYFRYQSDQDGFSQPLPPEFHLPPLASTKDVKQTIHIAAAKFDQTSDDGAWSVNADFAYEHRFGHHCTSCHGPEQKPEFQEQEDHGHQLFGELRLGIHKIAHNDLLIGGDFRRRDSADHVHELLPPDPNTKVVTAYNRLAGYVQDQISLADDKLNLYLGARYDASTDLYDSFVSPRAHFVYNATKSFVVRGGWSRAHRIPNFYELYQDSWFLAAGPVPFALFVPNPNLKPEKIEQFELGGEVRVSRDVSLKVDLFRSRVEDFIVIDRPGLPVPAEIFQSVNHPDTARILGGEVELRGQIGKSLIGFVNYAYLDFKAEKGLLTPGGQPLDPTYAPKSKINVGAYFGPYSGVSGSFDFSWRKGAFAPREWYAANAIFGVEPGTYAPLPDTGFMNFRLNYDLPFDLGSLHQPVRLSVYGRNLLDETDVEYADFTGLDRDRSLGREFFGEVAFRF
jgi:outer membrane receptor protein involved in Fe transport